MGGGGVVGCCKDFLYFGCCQNADSFQYYYCCCLFIWLNVDEAEFSMHTHTPTKP